MDRRPTLEARPPALIDAAVRLLVPVPCREHVIGDLWERYRSPRSFVLDALRTIPFVVISQVRRTSTLNAVVIQLFVLSVSGMVGAGLRRAAAPTIAAIVTLILRDAYKRHVSMSARQVLVDVGIAIGAMIVCESIVAAAWPSLLLPWRAMAGAVVGFVMLFLLRLQNPGLGTYVRRLGADGPLTVETLTSEVRTFERTGRRAVRIEMFAGMSLAVMFVVPMLLAPNWIMRLGWVFGSAYGLYVAAIMRSRAPTAMPEGLDFDATATFYSHQLERRVSSLETMWRWYILPGAPAMVCIAIGAASLLAQRGRPIYPALAVVVIGVVVALVLHSGSRSAARKLRSRIERLHRRES